MPRKKKIDHTRYETAEYWNQLLADAGLSVDAGRSPKVVYVGGSKDLDIVHQLENSPSPRGAKKPRSD